MMSRRACSRLVFGAVLPLVLLLCLPSYVSTNQLLPFKSDGCSLFFEGTYSDRDLWLDCCVAHDMAYWRGGTFNERRAADEALKRCVAETGQQFVAEIMEKGVRAGGSPFFLTSYRWGYGWREPRGYFTLTEAERQMAEQLLQESQQQREKQ